MLKKQLTLFIFSLIAATSALSQEAGILTIVHVLKNGRPGETAIIQGEIQQIDRNNNRIMLNDGTFQLWVYLTEKDRNLPFSMRDKLLLRGIIQAPFLQGNVIVATDIQKIANLVPQGTKVKPAQPRQTPYSEQAAPKPVSDPNAIFPILNIISNVPADRFVNVIGKVQRFIENDVIVLEDETGNMPVLLQSEHQFLNLETGEKLHLRAKVMQNEKGTKSLFAVYLELPERKDGPSKPTLSHLSKNQAPAISPLPKTLPQPVLAPKNNKHDKIISKSVIMKAEPAPTKPTPVTPPAKPMAETQKVATQADAPKTERSLEERLELIKRLLEKGLINEEEYNSKRNEILSEL